MDHTSSIRPSERPHGQGPPFTPYSHPFSPHTAQPPLQIPHSDPFTTGRDPFLPGNRDRRGSFGIGSRAWHSQGTSGYSSLTLSSKRAGGFGSDAKSYHATPRAHRSPRRIAVREEQAPRAERQVFGSACGPSQGSGQVSHTLDYVGRHA